MMTQSRWLQVIYIFCMLRDVATNSKEWNISFTQRMFHVEPGKNITINCTVEYPHPKTNNSTIQGFWKVKGVEKTCTPDIKDLIANTNNTTVLATFQGRTQALGKIENNNCSLLISNIQSNHAGEYYFRLYAGGVYYNFCKETITITVKGPTSNVTGKAVPQDFTENPVSATYVPGTPAPLTYISIFIFVPIILLAVVIVAVIVFLLRRRKRRRHPVRQDSSYYVNFRPPCEMQQDGPKLTEKLEKKLEPPPFTPAPIDEPIYSNVQGKTLEEPPASEHMENIYSNIGIGIQ